MKNETTTLTNSGMKPPISLLLLLLVSGCAAQPVANVDQNKRPLTAERKSIIDKPVWIHGSPDCDNNMDPVHDAYQHSHNTFIIRQNKCLNFEAPFIYVLVGEEKILVVDTGAINDKPKSSLDKEIQMLLGKEQFFSKDILVVHSHGHSDHYQGDAYFEKHSNVTLIKPTAIEVHAFFGFSDWPQGQATIDLGHRQLTVIPTPGHQEEAITIYDHQTKWLLTGDTLYPGLIYVKDWQAYRNSIEKLAMFAKNHEIKAIMGGHIEMNRRAASHYPIGATYQPHEAQLDLSVDSLRILNARLQQTDGPTELIFNDFIVRPMGIIQKTLSNIVRWLTQ